MKLYKFTKTDRVGYDEYDSVLIRANSLEKAWEIAGQYDMISHDNPKGKACNARVTIITEDGITGVIIGSYNAG